MNRFFFIILQFSLYIDTTNQSRVRQAMKTLKVIGNTMKKPITKTFGNTIKNTVSMISRSKNTIKKLAFVPQDKYLATKHNIGVRAIKYLGEEGIKKFKYVAPKAIRGCKQNIQMNAKGIRSVVKRSSGQVMGPQLRSLINMISKSKPQLPLLVAAGGLNRLTAFNLVPEDMEKTEQSGDKNDPLQELKDNVHKKHNKYLSKEIPEKDQDYFSPVLKSIFDKTPTPNFSNLTHEQAKARFKSIRKGSIYYEYVLNLNKGTKYNGEAIIDFEVDDVWSVFQQYVGKSFEFVSINGKEVPKVDGSHEYLRHAGFLQIPIDLLSEKNRIIINFENLYDTDGQGFHSYTDIDDKQYVFSHLEAGWANRLFPIFDQPDLKAPYKLSVNAPKEWSVISTNEPKKEAVNEQITNWKFGWTKPHPSYLYTVIAGPYKEIKASESELHRGLSMSIYSRESLSEYAEAQKKDVFEFNADSIKRYEKLFGYDYPYKKCDTIFCPEFASGAMENPAAITYTEQYLYKKVPTTTEITNRGSTIVHELAHMWFGNLVTMKWWNDLWLNESFADFVNYIVMADQHKELSFDINDAWTMFNMRKGIGYRADQMESTHPIYSEVCDISAAGSIFDGITYCKGGAVMRQLYALIGRETFSKSMQRYFQKYQYDNATLNDLLHEMQGVLDEKNGSAIVPEHLNLQKYRKDWIETAGLNTVTCQFDRENFTKTGKLTLQQGAYLEAHKTLRYHKMKIGLYDKNGNLISEPEILLQNQKETVVDISKIDFNREDVHAVIPNVGDQTFIQILQDPISLDIIKNNISKIESELTRSLVYRSWFDMVRNTQTQKSTDLIELLIKNIPLEKSAYVQSNNFQYLGGLMEMYCPADKYDTLMTKGFDMLYDMLKKETDQDKISKLQSKLVDFGWSDKSLKVLSEWLEGKHDEFKHQKLNLEDKWKIISYIFVREEGTLEWRNNLRHMVESQDKTDVKLEYDYRIKAMTANKEERQQLWEQYMNPDSGLSYHMLGKSIGGFNSKWVDYSLREPYFKMYYDNILQVLKTRGKNFSSKLFHGLKPHYKDNSEAILMNKSKLEGKIDEVDMYWRKNLKEEFESDIRTKKVQDFAS